MPGKKFTENSKGMRIIQHLAFIALSFFILLHLFKFTSPPATVDFVYTGFFLASVLPVVYLHLYWLLPKLENNTGFIYYIVPLILLTALFSWMNIQLFDRWSANLFPGFYFISYYTWWEIVLFFIVFIVITTLLKLSKSWFIVNRLQRALLEKEKQRVQQELKALKAQINPHFFFNTLNNIYSMSLDRDERLPGTVLQLSELMRYFLYDSKEDLVPLAKEIQMLKDYLALQKIRSNDQLNVQMEIDNQIGQQKIAPLLLITFLENAFKHGAKGETGNTFINLNISMTNNLLNFSLENNKGTADIIEKTDHEGLGLKNVKRRLELIYPGRHDLLIKDKEASFLINLQLQL
ncbi:MAG TPA: histidine kinase [Chitinophagaceae bacterium]|nr:histidine kinase [Chitinophagaceae bacterium]